MVVASPMRRTIYTALLGFEADIKSKGLKIVALPEVQETSDVACDTGTDIEALKKEVQEKELPVDLDLVQADWNSNVGWVLTAPIRGFFKKLSVHYDADWWFHTLAREMGTFCLCNCKPCERSTSLAEVSA